jgi:hypothetical protein
MKHCADPSVATRTGDSHSVIGSAQLGVDMEYISRA